MVNRVSRHKCMSSLEILQSYHCVQWQDYASLRPKWIYVQKKPRYVQNCDVTSKRSLRPKKRRYNQNTAALRPKTRHVKRRTVVTSKKWSLRPRIRKTFYFPRKKFVQQFPDQGARAEVCGVRSCATLRRGWSSWAHHCSTGSKSAGSWGEATGSWNRWQNRRAPDPIARWQLGGHWPERRSLRVQRAAQTEGKGLPTAGKIARQREFAYKGWLDLTVYGMVRPNCVRFFISAWA